MQRKNREKIVKKFLLTVVFTTAFTAGAIAQTGIPSRAPPFGRGYAINDPMYGPSRGAYASRSDQSISPRDPPFGKGNADNDTMHLPNQTDLSGRFR